VVKDAILAAQWFHLDRVLFSCGKLDIDASRC
jgi:vancomycin permeability regulator SanA